VVVVHNEERISFEGGISRSILTLKNIVGFQSSNIDGIGLIIADFNPCPYQISTSMVGLETARRLTKQEIVI
jgi:hypothetical protein